MQIGDGNDFSQGIPEEPSKPPQIYCCTTAMTRLARIHGAANVGAFGGAIDAGKREDGTNDTAETFASNET